MPCFVPEIRRQLLHAAREQVGILDGLVARVVLGVHADDRRLDAQIDVLGHQRDPGVGEFLLQRERVGEKGVVGAVARDAFRQRGFEQLRLEKQPSRGRALAVIHRHRGRQRETAVDLLLGGALHQLVEKAADLAHVAGRLRDAFLARIELLEHGHRNVDVVLLEAEYRRRVVHEHVGVEHENAPLLARLAHLGNGGRHRPRRPRHSAFTAASTASAWPFTLTLRHSARSTPCASMRNVLRSTPMYFLPYMLFS